MSGYKTDNTAYDLSLFDTNLRQKKEYVIEVATNKSSFKAKRMAAVNIIVAVLIACMCAVLVNSYAKLTELTSGVASLQKEYKVLQSENRRLEVQLRGKTDLREIEDIAVNQYYMQRVSRSQVEYIALESEDRAVVYAKEDGGALDRFFKAVKTKAALAIEYFR